jgi:hypothetical protein
VKPTTIILNCLPPGNLDMPSSSLSILKAFLKYHGYNVKVIYWNFIILESILKHLPLNISVISANDLTVLSILPYLLTTNNNYLKQNKLVEIIKKYYIKEVDNSTIIKDIIKLQKQVDNIITLKLNKLNNEYQIPLFGISAKYYEWIYGIDLIKKIKSINPDIKTVIGGFSQLESAQTFISMEPDIDFSMYGECEYSLKILSDELNALKPNYQNILNNTFYKENKCVLRGSGSSKACDFSFRDSVFPDYSDYMQVCNSSDLKKYFTIKFPLDGTRGCSWNKCRFCVATRGIKFYERTAKSLNEEIRYQSEKHNIFSFYTTDDDFNSRNSERIKDFSLLRIEHPDDRNVYKLETWLTPKKVSREQLELFNSVFDLKLKAGFEATSDSLLRKMRKENRFIHNILFLKYWQSISPDFKMTYSIIMGIPDETKDDVEDALSNLDYLRFFIPRNVTLCFNKFQLSYGSSYYRAMPQKEKEAYLPDGYAIYVNEKYLKGDNKYLFFFNTLLKLANEQQWKIHYEKVEGLINQQYNYQVTENSIIEYKNKNINKTININKTEKQLLHLLNYQFLSEESIIKELTNTGKEKNEILNSINNLHSNKILYTNGAAFISVINPGLNILHYESNFNKPSKYI